MGPIQMFAHRLWRGDAGFLGVVVTLMLMPLEWIWRYHVKSQNHRFDNTNPVHIDGLRVISIGNLAVGGTGKTPIASWVARDLAEAGKKPCLVHGGYGMDEPALHRRWTPDIPVFVQRDRVAGAHEARLAGARSIVLDDADLAATLAQLEAEAGCVSYAAVIDADLAFELPLLGLGWNIPERLN